MSASPDQIRATVERYVALVATPKSSDDIVALFAEGATVEDPVGTPVRTTRAEIKEFFGALDDLQIETELREVRVAGSGAAFSFDLTTLTEGGRMKISPIDVMSFDDDARITSMRAFWSDADVSFG